MRREQLLREIAEIDDRINQAVTSAELPTFEYKPFPLGTWILAIMLFAWSRFGSMIPEAYAYYDQTKTYAFYGAIVLGALALIRSVLWLLRGHGGRAYQKKSSAYMEASRDARELQEKRRELQAELRAISGE